MMAEVPGRARGTRRGEGGSMWVADLRVGMPGAARIVGGPPLARDVAPGAGTLEAGAVPASFSGGGAVDRATTAASLAPAMAWRPPVVLVERRMLREEGEVPDGPHPIPFGEARVPPEDGDAASVVFGRMVGRPREAGDVLVREGVDVGVVEPRTTSPLDAGTAREFAEERGQVVADEAGPGRGMAPPAADAFGAFEIPVLKVTPSHAPVPHAPEPEDPHLPDDTRTSEARRPTPRPAAA